MSTVLRCPACNTRLGVDDEGTIFCPQCRVDKVMAKLAEARR